MDPSAEQEANVPEAGETQDANVPEAGEAQEANVPEVGEAQEANVPEVGEAQETGEAGKTQEKLWELPKNIQASKAVYNIQKNDNDCFYWKSNLQQNCEDSRKRADVAEEKNVFGGEYGHQKALDGPPAGQRRHGRP